MSAEDPRPRPPAREGGLIAAAIVAAALIISWGISGSEPRYQLASSGSGVVRMDMDSGEMIACEAQRCARIAAPDRARSFGIGVQIGDSEKDRANALPPPAKN